MTPLAKEEFETELNSIYVQYMGGHVTRHPETDDILDAFSDLLSNDALAGIRTRMTILPFLPDRFKESDDALFKTPVGFFMVLLIMRHRARVKRDWPLGFDRLSPLCSWLGIAWRHGR